MAFNMILNVGLDCVMAASPDFTSIFMLLGR